MEKDEKSVGLQSADNVFDVSISQEEVFEAARREASYIASKSVQDNDSGAYDRISITEADEPLLLTFWKECAAEIGRSMRPYVRVYWNESDLSFEVRGSEGMNVDAGEITALLTKYVKDMMLYKWLTFTSSGMADRYGNMVMATLDEVSMRLGARKIVGRDDITKGNDDVTQKPSAMRGGADGEDDEEMVGTDEVSCGVPSSGDDVTQKPVAVEGGAADENDDAVGVVMTWKDAEAKRRDALSGGFGVVEVVTKS